MTTLKELRAFTRQYREIVSRREKRQQEEAKHEIWNSLRSKGTFSIVVKTGEGEEALTEICAKDPLHVIKRKLAAIQKEHKGKKLRLTCGCVVIPQDEWQILGVTLPSSYWLLHRPYYRKCDADGCIHRACLAKNLNVEVNCDKEQLTPSFWIEAEKRVKEEKRRAGLEVRAYMCYPHFIDNYKRDCPNCAHAFIPAFRDEI